MHAAIDVSWTGDLPGLYGHRPAHRERPVDLMTTPGVDRPAFERHDLEFFSVEARVWRRAKGPAAIGRVLDASVTGLLLSIKKPFAAGTRVKTTLLVPGGFSAQFPGRVVRSNGDSMALHLETSDQTWRFRSAWLELARSGDGDRPSVVVMRSDKRPSKKGVDLSHFGVAWDQVVANIDEAEPHETFIRFCADKERLEFALERYRELRGGPDDDVAQRYLAQLGPDLGFQQSSDKAGWFRTLWSKLNG